MQCSVDGFVKHGFSIDHGIVSFVFSLAFAMSLLRYDASALTFFV